MDEWGEICPGCSLMFTGTCNIARIIPGCSHNLCEKCILTDGTNTGQVKCGSPGCPTSIPWTNRLDQFLPNMFILGSVTYRQHCESEAPVPRNSVDILENVNDEIVGVTRSSESKVDKCEVMCGECEKSSADCLCQKCHSYLCSNCFDKIHKMAKSLLNHKSLPIVTDYNGQKIEQQVKLSNCTDHGKKIEYVAKGGEMGCAQCVIFGNLKGLDATTVVTYNKNIKKDLREKIEEGRSKIERLKSVLSGLKSKRCVKEDKSSEDLTEEIKRHFSECHSHLQTLEHQLCQKLEKHQIELTAWQRNIDVLIKSTASKIDEVTDVLQFSEEAVSNDAVLDIFNFNEILSLLAIIDDEASEAVEQTRPDSSSLAIEPSFKHHLMSHVTLNKSAPSSFSHPTGASPSLASSTLLALDYCGSSPSKIISPVISSTCMAFDSAGSSSKMNSAVVSSTCMVFDSAGSSSPKMNSPVVSSTCMDFVSAGSFPSTKIDLLVSGSEIIPLSSPEIYLTVPAEMDHQEMKQTEVLQQETNRREKVSDQEVQQREKVSEREVQQLDKVAQREVQQLENVLLTSSTTDGEQFYSLRTSVMEPSPAAPSAFTALDTTESSSFSEMASFVSESELPSSPLDPFPPTTSLTVSNEFYPPTTPVPEPSIVRSLDFTGSSPPPHMAPLLLESEISPSPLSPKVAQQLVKMSPLEIEQPQISQQHLSPDISTASSLFSLEHPIPSAQTVWISYQGGNNSTRCVDIDELSPQRTWMERQERLFPASCVEGYDKDEKISPSKKEKHQKSAGGRDRGVLSKSWKKSTKVNARRNLIEKNLHQSKITKVKEGESRESSPPDWNSVFKKSIQKIKAQKQAPNLKRIYEQITRTHRNLNPISDDIVEKKLDKAVKKGVLERIVKDEKVTFRVTRRPRFKVARKLLSTPSASPLDDLNGVGLDKNDFLAMLGLQEKVNV